MPRGRTRDEEARRRILDATFALVGTRGGDAVTVDEIAAAAQVGKQTIYRWWPSKTALELDALVDGTMRATPFRETDDVRADFERHLRSVIRLFNSPTGRIVRSQLGESCVDDEAATEFRDRFWAPRRELSRRRLERGIELGQVRNGIDVELVLDVVYGALWTRLAIGHLPMRAADARRVVDVVWPGIAGPATRT